MKIKTQKIISFIIAVIAGFADYILLTIVKSLCYYSGDGTVMSPDLKEAARNACYDKYSLGRFLLEIVLVALVAYFISMFIFSFFRKK